MPAARDRMLCEPVDLRREKRVTRSLGSLLGFLLLGRSMKAGQRSRFGTALLIRLLILAGLYALFLAGGGSLGAWITMVFNADAAAEFDDMMLRVLLTGFAVYVVLTAIPFVPGVEIGLALIFMVGTEMVPFVYLATVASLTLSFLIGRLVPEAALAAAFRAFGLERAEALVRDMAPLDNRERIQFLIDKAPSGWVPFLVKYRLIAIAVLLNVPGSSLIGGGGGISMAVGLSRLVRLPVFVLTVAIAVSPLPILILLGKNLV